MPVGVGVVRCEQTTPTHSDRASGEQAREAQQQTDPQRPRGQDSETDEHQRTKQRAVEDWVALKPRF